MMTPSSPDQRDASPRITRLVEMWLGFLIKHQGRWSQGDETGLRAWADYVQPGTDAEFEQARGLALDMWQKHPKCVVVCAGSMCAPKRPRPDGAMVGRLEQVFGCPVLISDCQNRCRQAPSTTRIDHGSDPRWPAKPM